MEEGRGDSVKTLDGKHALAFMALAMHNRILTPVINILKERGMTATFFTAAAEAAFEITFNEAGLPYRHALEVMPKVRSQIDAGWPILRDEWANRVLKSRWVLHGVPITIQDKIIRSQLENLHCFRTILEEEKPDICFALHELNSWGKILGYLCNEMGIPYLTFQEGLCYGHPFLYQMHVEYSTACVCWGDADGQILIDAGGDPKKVFKLGSVDLFPAIERTTSPECIKATREKLRIPPSMQVVLFLMSHANYNVFDLTPYIMWIMERGRIATIFKWHPSLSKEVVKNATSQFGRVPYVYSLQDADPYELLGIADVCVLVGNSTTGTEALAYRKPLVEVPLPNHTYSFSARGVADEVRGFEDIGPQVEKFLRDGISEERKAKVEEYLNSHFAYQDCHTAVRVADLAERILLEKSDGKRESEREGVCDSDSLHPLVFI